MLNRAITEEVRRDLDRKIVLLSGPRQCGKTTLARSLFAQHEYLSYDFPDHRLAIERRTWNRQTPLLVLDELHKKRDWKRWLKGIYDVEGIPPRILVTGSARLDMARRAGDSLAGRYFGFRLYPFDHAELAGQMPAVEIHRRLRLCGGFPEPFTIGDAQYYHRWHRSHLDIILRQDLIELEQVRDVIGIQTLVELLKERVGAPLSFASLARDLQRDAKTVKHWIGVLESLYVVFMVPPWSKSMARSIRKEPKIYFYDVGMLSDRPGAQLENIVALSLRKELHRLEDTEGRNTRLHYLRTTDGKEIDFLVQIDQRRAVMLEVKTADASPSGAFKHFAQGLPNARGVQLVESLGREHSYPTGLEIRDLGKWLTSLPRELAE